MEHDKPGPEAYPRAKVGNKIAVTAIVAFVDMDEDIRRYSAYQVAARVLSPPYLAEHIDTVASMPREPHIIRTLLTRTTHK
jgi:hypothetical protein